MKKEYIFIVILFILPSLFFYLKHKETGKESGTEESVSYNAPDALSKDQGKSGFEEPLGNAKSRVTKKPFGIYVAPDNSPVKPERFQGYHTGTDFETFQDEQNNEIPIKSVCNGKLLAKRSASGYGGVAIQACQLDGNPITVIYGHLKLSSIKENVDENLKTGDVIGFWGKGYSTETGGERKHLHLGFHKGNLINIAGYVSSKDQLPDWIDPCLYICK